MPLAHFSKLYGIKDCKIYKMLTDPAGGSATYSTAVDIPGIQAIGPFTKGFNVKLLKGDNTLLDADSTNSEGYTGKLVAAKLNLDAESVILGGTVADSGTTPNQVTTYTEFGGSSATPSVPNYFKIEAQAASADFVGGDAHVIFPKCRITNHQAIGLPEEDYQKYDIDIICLPTLADGTWRQVVFHETAVAIT